MQKQQIINEILAFTVNLFFLPFFFPLYNLQVIVGFRIQAKFAPKKLVGLKGQFMIT